MSSKRKKYERQQKRRAQQKKADHPPSEPPTPIGNQIYVPKPIDSKPDEEPRADKGDGQRKMPNESPVERYARKQTTYTLVLTVATVVSVAVAIYQWMAMRQQNAKIDASNRIAVAAAVAAQQSNSIMQRTAEIQLRAYVGVEEAHVRWSPEESAAILSLSIKNYGQTPARGISLQVSIGKLADATDEAFQVATEPKWIDDLGERIIGAGGSANYEVKSSMSMEEWRAITRDAQVGVSAIISFTDVYGEPRQMAGYAKWDGENLIWKYQMEENEGPPLPLKIETPDVGTERQNRK